MWLRECPENRRVYAQLKLAFLYPGATDRALLEKRVMANIKKKLASDRQTVDKSFFLQRWTQVAACFLLFLSFSFVVYLWNSHGREKISEAHPTEKVTFPGQKITTRLPDGTVVQLNSDSKLVIPEFFADDVREVYLTGEAFFDVVKDSSRPFVIRTPGLKVKVLGTSFNVRAYKNDTAESVAVKSGEVTVSRLLSQDDVMLTPNEMVSIVEHGGFEKAVIADQDQVFGWTERRLVFVDEPLDRVLETISRWYGVSIDTEAEILVQKPYTANYENPVLNEVMTSLSHVYNFHYTITADEKKIIIR